MSNRLLLQVDGSLHLPCPPSGEITTTTGTNHLVTIAPCSSLGNRGAEQCPVRLTWNAVALAEVRVEDELGRGLCQVFLMRPDYTFGCRTTASKLHIMSTSGHLVEQNNGNIASYCSHSLTLKVVLVQDIVV